jgi:hypothetical protein
MSNGTIESIEENKVLESPVHSDHDHLLHFLALPHPRKRTISEYNLFIIN